MKLLNHSFLIYFLLISIAVTFFSIPTNKELGLLYFKSFQYNLAFEYLDHEIKDSKEDIKILKTMKDYFLLKGENHQALKIQEKLVTLRPRNEHYYLELEKLYDWTLNPVAKLDVQYKRANLYKLEKKRKLLIEIAEGYRWAREFDKASQIYLVLKNSFIELDPETRTRVMNYYLALKDTDTVLELINLVNNEEKLKPIYVDSLAEIYLEKKEYLTAIKYLKISIANYDENLANKRHFIWEMDIQDVVDKASKIQQLMRFYLKLGKEELCLELEDDLYKVIGKGSRDLLELAFLYQQEGAVGIAEKRFEELLNMDLQKVTENDLKQATYYFLDDKHPDQVLTGYQKLYKLNPKEIEYVKFLAEHFEKIGDKRKALKFYKELLKLQEKRSQTNLWKRLMKSAIAFNVKVKEFELKNIPHVQLNTEKLKEKRIAETEYKILYLHEDLKQFSEAEKVYKSLLRKDPRNKVLLQGLAYNLWNRNKKKEAYKYFQRLLRASPKDRDALEILSSKNFIEKKYQNAAYYKMKQLKLYGLDFNGFSILEESLFQIGKDKSHKKLCESLYSKRWDRSVKEQEALELNYRCALRLKDKKKSLYFATLLVNKTQTEPYYSDLFYMSVEQGNFVFAKEVLKKAEDRKIKLESEKEMKSILAEYFKKPEVIQYEKESVQEEKKKSYVSLQQQFVTQNQFSYSNTKAFGIIDRKDLPFGPVVRYNKTLNSSPSTSNYQVGIGSLIDKETSQIFLFGGLTGGDKKSSPTFEGSYSKYDEKQYFSITGAYNEPSNDSQQIFLDRDALKSSLEGYFEKEDQNLLTLSGGMRVYNYLEDQSSQDYEAGSYLFKVYDSFFMGPMLYRASLHQQNRVSSVYVQDSLSYAIRSYYRKRWDNRKNEFSVGFNYGGDIEREIAVGGIIVLQSNYSYYWEDGSWFRANFEYLRESVSVSTGDSMVFGINYNSWF